MPSSKPKRRGKIPTDARWSTRLGRFVLAYRANKLAEALGIRRTAIHHWIDGTTQPRPENARKLVELAKEIGIRLSLQDVYSHAETARQKASVQG